ncbi:hypothetical protein [Desnuesiella massiliensis]|uniref:hypothetical protein n=1 Tax=Desnuesiella massiliensis TaxID=1650662 RepID=UPI0006E2007A|nr:hypothetical protein [Desnuesiella massiliensis]
MKKWSILIFLMSIILIPGGCKSTIKNSSNSLNITKEDEKIIQQYLDTKTNDISSTKSGKMYSAFILLGTDNDKIYVWMLKEECIKDGSDVIMTNGVSSPVVLYVKTGETGIKIKSHKSPKDGEEYGKSIKKLFPQNAIDLISNISNERMAQLKEVIKNRVKEDIEN